MNHRNNKIPMSCLMLAWDRKMWQKYAIKQDSFYLKKQNTAKYLKTDKKLGTYRYEWFVIIHSKSLNKKTDNASKVLQEFLINRVVKLRSNQS